MGNNLQQSEIQAQVDDGISLIDILLFFKGAWKTITIFGLAGAALSITYLAFAPEQYRAISQFTMAQIGTTSRNNINPLGVNIEEPALLIARLSSPTSFTPEVGTACGLQGQANATLALSKLIKLTIPKGIPNLVELKTFGPSPQVAEQCNFAVFELIKTSRSEIIAPYIDEARIKLVDDEARLAKAKDIVVKADKSGSAMGAVYLSTQDEIRHLLDEITTTKNIITSSQNRATRLIAPIYASDMPIAPKKPNILIAALFGGLLLGVFIVIGRRMMAKLKGEAGGL